MIKIDKVEPIHLADSSAIVNTSTSSNSSSSSMSFNHSQLSDSSSSPPASSAGSTAAAAAAAAGQYLANASNIVLTTSDSNNNQINVSSSSSSSFLNSSMMSSGTSSNDSICGVNGVNGLAGSDTDLNANFNEFSSKTNLIVNYLPQNMTQDEIKSLFSTIGPVDSCKLIKDKLSGQSLGYAFVNFVKQEDAEKAINSLNGMRLQNKTIKVSFARPSSESIKGANLYICGLHKDFTQADLEKMFTQFGTIISSKILTDPKSGVSKGVGFVRFDQRMEAEVAIAKLNGKTLEGFSEPLVVKFANTPTSVKSVMGLPLVPFVPTYRGFFQPYRLSNNANYRYSPMSGYCVDSNLLPHQPTALTSLVAPAATVAAASLASPLTCTPTPPAPAVIQAIVSTTPTVPAATPPAKSLSSTSISSVNYSGWCIFVYNLGPETDENILWQLFGPFGAVQSIKVVRDPLTQKCKGFGFVTMTNYDEAITAINCLNGLNLQNRILQVSFKTSGKQLF